jgi:glutamate mutase epsilon subunit
LAINKAAGARLIPPALSEDSFVIEVVLKVEIGVSRHNDCQRNFGNLITDRADMGAFRMSSPVARQVPSYDFRERTKAFVDLRGKKHLAEGNQFL